MADAPYRHGIARLEVGGRPTPVLVDTAGTALCLRQSLADELDLTVHEWVDDRGAPVSVLEPPELRVGDTVVDTDGLVAYGFEDVHPLGLDARRADVLLPASVLRRHRVVLDDPGGVLSVGEAERRGVAVPVTIDPDTGVLVTSVEVEGDVVDLVVDSALTCCLAMDDVVRGWQSSHPDWPASASAVGPGNMTGMAAEARVPMLRVPLVQWGRFSLPQVAFAWRGAGELAADGALGGNVLRLFRLDIDYAGGSLRVEQGAPFGENDAELVGVVLAAGDDGWEVAATVSGLDVVLPGDSLVAVDGTEVADLALPDVLDRLRGTPGDRHHLALRRAGTPVEVDVPVLRLL